MTAASAAQMCGCGKPVYAKGKCKACLYREYNRNWIETHREQHNRNVKEWRHRNPDKYKAALEKSNKKLVCQVLRKHHEDMKDDPEHLTTDFLKKLLKVECEVQE